MPRGAAKAAALAPTRLDVQLDYANALIDGSSDLAKTLPPHFAETVTKIRTLAPDNPLALYYGGLVARAQGDKQAAKDMWLKVLALIPEGSAQRTSLQREIDSLASCAPIFWLNRNFVTCLVISDCPVWLGDSFIADTRLGYSAIDVLEGIFNYAARADPGWKPTGHEILQARRDLKMLRDSLST